MRHIFFACLDRWIDPPRHFVLSSAALIFAIFMPVCMAHAEEPDGKPIEIRLVTQSFAPLQYSQDGQARGYVVETLHQMARMLEQESPIRFQPVEFLPWKRAMEIAKTRPNVLFFSVSRTAERETWFHWIGEVSPYGQYFFKLKTHPAIKATRLSDLRYGGHRIGLQSGSSLQRLMENQEIINGNNVVTYTDYHQGVKMLFAGRLDMVPLTGFIARSSVCGMGLDGDQLEPVVPISELARPLWLVMSLPTPVETARQVSDALSRLNQDGIREQIVTNYLEDWNKRPCKADP